MPNEDLTEDSLERMSTIVVSNLRVPIENAVDRKMADAEREFVNILRNLEARVAVLEAKQTEVKPST